MVYVVLGQDANPVQHFDIDENPRQRALELGIDLTSTAIEQFVGTVATKLKGVISEYFYHTSMPEESFKTFIYSRYPGVGYDSPRVEHIQKEAKRGYRVYLWNAYS